MCEEEQTSITKHSILRTQRLHPAGMFFSLLKVIKDTIFGLGVGVIATFRQSPKYALIFIGVFILFLIAYSIFSWFRYTYRVEEGELRIEQGIFIRKKRYISINRIHKIDVTANVLHRIFKLVQVQIDTASSGGGAEVSLSAVKMKDAEKLRIALKGDKYQSQERAAHSDAIHNPVRKITWKRLFIAGSTSGSIGFMLLAMIAIFSQIGEFIPEQAYNQTYEWIIQLSIVFIIVLAIFGLILLWFVGIAGTMIKYGDFTIEKREKELFIKRGLLETKELTIPFDRIQAIEIEQGILRQPIKFVRITAVIAGGSFDKGEPFPVLFPLMHVNDVEAFLEKFVPNYSGITKELHPLGEKGKKYYMFQAAVSFSLVFIPVIYFFPMYSWIPALFIVVGIAYGLLSFKESGYQIENKRIIFRYRSNFTKTTMMTYHRRIQSFEKKQNKLQQWEKLATTKVSLIGLSGMGTHFKLKHVSNDDANRIADWYSRRKDILE